VIGRSRTLDKELSVVAEARASYGLKQDRSVEVHDCGTSGRVVMELMLHVI
jgi:hypothetical protein